MSATRSPHSSLPSTARCSPTRRARSTRGIEIVEFACGIPQLLKGDFTDRCPPASITGPCAATGRGRRHHAVQFSVHGAVLDVSLAHRVRQHLRVEAERTRSVGLDVHGGTDARKPACPGRVQRGAGRQERRRCAARSSATSQAVSFVGSTAVAQYIYRTRRAAGKRVQALGGAKNHLVVMPDADLEQAVDGLIGAAYGSAGERCMAISVAVLVGDARRRDCRAHRARARAARSAKAWRAMPRWARSSPAARERISGYIEDGVAKARSCWWTGASFSVPGHENGFFPGGDVVRPRHPADAHLPGGDLRAGAGRACACRPGEAVQLVDAHGFANGVLLHARRQHGTRVRPRDRGRHGRHQRADTGTDGVARLRRLEDSLFGDMHAYGEEGVRFYTRQKSMMQRWPESTPKGPEFVMPTAK